jgi:septal ring factor EnvC (AmiA/AmiB activator)
MWRNLKRTSRAFSAQTAAITRSLDEIDGHLQRAGKSNDQLAAAAERLRSSRERLAVQLAAVHEARVAVTRTFWFLPGR